MIVLADETKKMIIFAQQMTKTENTTIFKRPLWVAIFALTAAIAWGWAYPLIKLGFAAFQIEPEMTGSKMLFAGIRFFLSGLIILLIAANTKRSFKIRKKTDWWFLLTFAIFNTTLHYAFFYFGLSHSEGSRAAILNSISTFIIVLLACIFYKSDRLTKQKILGCSIGFLGILALNIGGQKSGKFTWLGDGMIILNALCSAIAGLMTRSLSNRIDIFVGTGYSLTIGGALLILPGLLTGGYLPTINIHGIIYLVLLISISTIAFALYNKIISVNPVGKVAIYTSLVPIVGAVTSCICLGEQFHWKYAIAGVLAALGIFIINKGKQ